MIGTVTAFVFVAVVAGFAAIGLLYQARRMRVREAMRRRLGQLTTEDGLIREGVDEEAGGLARLLTESGLEWNTTAFLVRATVAATFGLLLGAMLGSGFLAVLFAGVGGGTLFIVVRRARAKRLAVCDEQMPQALEVMSLALRAGHAMPSALALAAEEAPAPLCHELKRASDEHALGRPISGVLQRLSERLPGCAAVNTFVVAVLVLEETGGNLISVIDRIVDNARARANYQARVRALTAEGRSSAKMLALLPIAFALLAAATDPSYREMLLHDSGGRAITVVALALWALGLLWTRRLVRVMR